MTHPSPPADHYGGITENWSAGPIYCSPITAALVQHLAGVGPQWLHPIPMDTPTVVQGARAHVQAQSSWSPCPGLWPCAGHEHVCFL